MPNPGAVLVLVLAFQAASTQHGATARTASTPTLDLPCCFASAQNATSLGPVVVLRRDDEKPSALGTTTTTTTSGATGATSTADPTWEATLRRAATRALTWEGLGDAPFVASHHSAAVLASLDEPSDIRVLARGLLVAAPDGRPVFREVDLPGEDCMPCPVDVPGPSGESIKAMWSVRRIRHSGPNADHRPCYELQFSVTPIAAALTPLSRWEPPTNLLGKAVDVPNWQAGLHAGLRAESRVSRQGGRDLRPKGLILRVNPIPDPLLHAVTLATPTTPVGTSRDDVAAGTTSTTTASLGTPAVAVLASSETRSPRPTVTGGSTRVHEHLHHHFYVRDGVSMYAGSTMETEYPTATQPFRPSPQYHEYSQVDPLFHPRPGRPVGQALGQALGQGLGHGLRHGLGHGLGSVTVLTTPTAQQTTPTTQPPAAYPNSINEQLPPVRDGTDTRVPYVASQQHAVVTTPGQPVVMRFPAEEAEEGPTVTIVPGRVPSRGPTTPLDEHTQVYRVTGSYTLTTPNSLHTRRPNKAVTKVPPKTLASLAAVAALAAHKSKVPTQNYYEVGRPTKAYPKVHPTTPPDLDDEAASPTGTPSTTTPPSEYLSEYPAGSVRGSTPAASPSTSRVPLFTPNYGSKDFEMSILKVMTSKVPSYIDIYTENGVRVTTVRPVETTGKAGKYANAVTDSTRFFKENPYGAPYSLINNSSELQSSQLSTTLQTKRPQGTETITSMRRRPQTTTVDSASSSSPLQITFFVATEDEAKQPAASTLVGDPFRQDDATTYQYTILHSVKQSIDLMKSENDTTNEDLQASTEPMAFTRRIYTSRDEQINDGDGWNSLSTGPTASLSDLQQQPLVNGHTYHRNEKLKNITENHSQILKNLSQPTEATTTRRPWRPSTKRPWRQRSNYKQFYSQRKRLNHTTTTTPTDPTSIVESRKTYSVTASRKRKPFPSHLGDSYQRAQRFHKRRSEQLHQPNTA